MNSTINRTLFLGLGHLANDFYPGLLSPLLPVFMDLFGWSIAQVGVLVTILQLFCNLTQPVIGVFNDHRPTKSFMWLGLMLSALPFLFIMHLHSLGLMGLAIAISSFGVGMFHPVAVVTAGHIAEEKRKGLLMALFSSGGNIGVMLSPLAAIVIVEVLGNSFMPLVVIPGFAVAFLYIMDDSIVVKESHGLSLREWFTSLFATGRILLILFLLSTVRAVVQTIFTSFLPILTLARGFSYTGSALFLSATLFTGMIGMFIGGHLSDIHGRRKIMALTMFISAPLYTGFLLTSGTSSIALLLAGTAALTSTLPINIIQAQEANPKLAGMASSLVMGLSFAVGGLTAGLFGLLADTIGIEKAMIVPAILPVIGGLIALLLKNND